MTKALSFTLTIHNVSVPVYCLAAVLLSIINRKRVARMWRECTALF